jgi:hypothetical protein
MMLGLAVLTVGAHVLAAAAHLLGGHADWRDWPLLVLLALAPLVGIVLAIRGRPRHGAIVLALTMSAAAWWTLHSHYVSASDLADPFAYAWIIQMTLAFELQGAAMGLILVAKPQVPRSRDEQTAAL